jgi:hypothetical protein
LIGGCSIVECAGSGGLDGTGELPRIAAIASEGRESPINHRSPIANHQRITGH